MKPFAFALILLLACVSLSRAAYVCPRVVNSETDGLPGFSTVELSIHVAPEEILRGFDATISGPLHQVQAAGMPTPFGNLNAFIPDDFHKDSQFLFLGNEDGLLSIGVEENGNLLKGAISGLANLDQPLPNLAPIARLVIAQSGPFDPIGHDIHLDIAVDVGLPEPLRATGTLFELAARCIPEPTTLMLTQLGLVLVAGFRRR